VLAALKKLREREGLTLAKLDGATSVKAALEDHLDHSNHSLKAFDMKLREILEAMGDGDHAEAVRNALGIGYPRDKGTVTDRRGYLALKRGKQSIDTIRNWEAKGFSELALLLIQSSSRHQPLEYDYLKVVRSSRWTNRSPERSVTERTIRSYVDGLQTIRLRAKRRAEMPDGYTEWKALYGAQIVDSFVSKDRQVTTAEVRLNRSLNRGEVGHFIIERVFNDDGLTRPMELFSPSSNRIHALQMRLEFDQGKPARVWRIDGQPHMVDALDPDIHPQIILPDTSCIEVSFSQLRGGFRYGIAWEWTTCS
jgi:hypothetical protein